MKLAQTKLGPISKVGAWTLALEITATESSRAARAAAYRIAADLCEAFEASGFDVRVAEGQHVRIHVEVGEAADLPVALKAMNQAAGSAAARMTR